jgi:hypothetical protein
LITCCRTHAITYPPINPIILGGKQMNIDISHGKAFQGRAINYRKDGSAFIMQWKIAPIHNEKNEITQYLAIQQLAFE